MVGAIIAVAVWAALLAWLIASALRDLLRARATRHARQDERANRERLRRQQRQIEALEALYELPSPSHRGGRTR